MEIAKNNKNGEWYFVLCVKKMSYCDVLCCVNYIERMDSVHYKWTFISQYENNEMTGAYETNIESIEQINDFSLTSLQYQYFQM